MQPGGPGFAGARPPTSGTQYGYRPPSSGGGGATFGAPGTANRRQQSPWTGAQPAAGKGVSLNTSVEVSARPVMREGMKGMHMPPQGAAGPKRQVLDRSYHLGKLRTKNAELQAELERLHEEEQRLQKNAGQREAIASKLKALETEVAKYKNELSDLNFAVEKSAGGVDIDKINEETNELKESNAQEKQQINLKFLERQRCEEKSKMVAQQASELTAQVEKKLQDEPQKRQEYYMKREESAELAATLFMKERELADINKRYQTMLQMLKADPQKMMQLQQQERVQKLKQKREELQSEFKGNLQEEKQLLLEQVKADVKEIELIQANIKEAKSELEEAKNKLRSLEGDLNELTGDKMGKFMQLEQRDQEMQAFIDSFDSEKAKQLAETRQTEESIVHLLEHIGDRLKQGNMLSRLTEIQEDLANRQKAYNESASTRERLKSELVARQKELEKVSNLEERINKELETVNKKIVENELAMKKYSDLDGLRQEHDERKKKLTSMKVTLTKRRDALRQEVNQFNREYETMLSDLQSNDVHQQLEPMEHKIRQIKQNYFQIVEFLKQKQAETAYIPIKAECIRKCEEINTFLKDPRRLEKASSRGRAF